jgi:hypothetical protein
MKAISYNSIYYHINKAFEECNLGNLIELEKHSFKLHGFSSNSVLFNGYYKLSLALIEKLKGNVNDSTKYFQEANIEFKESDNATGRAIACLMLSENNQTSKLTLQYLSYASNIFTAINDNIGLFSA